MRGIFRVGAAMAGAALMMLTTASSTQGDPAKAAVCDADLNESIDLCVYAYEAFSEVQASCINTSVKTFKMCMFAAGYREVHMETVGPNG